MNIGRESNYQTLAAAIETNRDYWLVEETFDGMETRKDSILLKFNTFSKLTDLGKLFASRNR